MNQLENISHYKPNGSNVFVAECVENATASNSSWYFLDSLRLRAETFFFVLANTLDVLLTFALLSTGAFREANPLANYVLQNWGMNGMIFFKFAFVAGILVIAHYIAARRIRTARALLNVGTLLVGLVVTYSGYLFTNFLLLN